ncbi:PE family protein [Mycobacterium sp. 852002-50816_SCH5313054-b]|uniref:PE family protein n=1 Tax=Mycobacterium sp. 852002-50816_SCH5313054-b TaxID=1834092 RepID=UPI0009EEEA24|nr:PE family protein [Mycobacterium sp. 852002-50816_SCH5313054-b]
MSLLNVVPDSLTAAAGNLQDIGAAVKNANAVAAGQTTAIAAPAADEVSAAITALFGANAKEFQTLTAEAMAFHEQFVSLLGGGAAQYLGAEVANIQQMLANAMNTPAQSVAGAAANPAAFDLWQTVTNFAGGGLVSQVGGAIYNGVARLESSVSGLAPLSLAPLTTSLAIGGAGVGTEVGQIVGGTIGSLIGPEGTVIGVLVGGEIGGTLGGLAGRFGPGIVIGQVFNQVTGLGDAVGSVIRGGVSYVGGLFDDAPNIGSILTGSPVTQLINDGNSNASNLAVDINSLFDTTTSGVTSTLSDPQSLLAPLSIFPAQLQTLTQLSNWGLGPSFTITSDVVGPWGADGIQQDVTGVFDFGAGPFSVQVGSFQGMSAADMYGGMSSVSATAFGIRESGSVYNSIGGSPQFSFSVDAPGVTGLLQDFATYLP